MLLFSSLLFSSLLSLPPFPDSNASNSKLLLRIDPSMAPPLLPFAWIVGILLALCVTHHRKPSKPHPHPQSPPDPPRSSTSTETRSPPPAPPERHAAQSGESPVGTPGRGRRRGLSLSASARVPERIVARMRVRRRERKERSAEESIWMKTIILGERCRVPSDDDDDDDESENGGGGLNGRRRPRHYRPRTPRSVPVSRTSSFLDLEEDAASSDAFGAGDQSRRRLQM